MALLDTMGLKRACRGTLLAGSNGVYLHGVDADLKTLRFVPDNCYLLGHVPSRHPLDGFRVLTILRDPRNVLLSYITHRKRDGLVYSYGHAMDDFWGHAFVDVYRGYLGWRGHSAIFRYEDLPPAVVGGGFGIYQNDTQDYNTATGSPSDWRKVWTEEFAQAWDAHDGPRLLVDAGY
jgi:hypothetical protein